MFAYTLTPKALNIFIGGKARVIDKTHINYEAIVERLKKKPSNVDRVHLSAWLRELINLIDVRTFIAEVTEGRVQIGEGKVYVAGQEAHGEIVKRLLTFFKEGFDIKPLCRFLDKLHDNPTEDVKKDLYLWLEASGMPLTEDGDFLAYKYVSNEYTSRGGFKNPVGELVKMPREECDDSRNNTCSRGLHFASWNYVCGSGPRKLVLKINPRDVVAIPYDYSNHKGRACQYQIIEEVTEEQSFDPIVSTCGTYEEPLETIGTAPDSSEPYADNSELEDPADGIEPDTDEVDVGCGCADHNDNHPEAVLVEEEPTPRPARPKIHIDEETGEPTFYPPKYAPFNAHTLIAAVKDMKNQRAFASEYDVPRTTLQGWLRKAEDWIKKSKKRKRK